MSPTDWDGSPPPPATLGDRAVPRLGDHLAGRRVALLVTGGIAAMKAPLTARALRKHGATVVAFASPEALRYVAQDALHWSTGSPVVTSLSPLAEHLSDEHPFDAWLVAPATYNTLNKVAAGVADSVVTAPLAGALGRLQRGETAVLVAPTMHGSMHNPILSRSLALLADLGVRVVPPRPGYGKHNIPHEDALVAEVARATSRSPLRGIAVEVVGAPVAEEAGFDATVAVEKGRLAAALAWELWARGADVRLLQTADAAAVRAPIDPISRGSRLRAGAWVVGWSPCGADFTLALPGPAAAGAPEAGATLVADLLESRARNA